MGQEDKVSAYFDLRAENYQEKSREGLWHRLRQREFAAVIELLAPKSGHRILDAGCGAGFYSRALQVDFGAQVTGIDISVKMIDQLHGSGVIGQVGNIADFSTDEPFDRIVAAGVLEFVTQPEQVFRVCFQALKEGGRLVALVPRAGLIGVAYTLAHGSCPTHVLPLADYKKLAAYSGFKFVEQIACTPISTALCWVR